MGLKIKSISVANGSGTTLPARQAAEAIQYNRKKMFMLKVER